MGRDCPASLRQNVACFNQETTAWVPLALSITACPTFPRPGLRRKRRRHHRPRTATEIMTAAHRARRLPGVWWIPRRKCRRTDRLRDRLADPTDPVPRAPLIIAADPALVNRPDHSRPIVPSAPALQHGTASRGSLGHDDEAAPARRLNQPTVCYTLQARPAPPPPPQRPVRSPAVRSPAAVPPHGAPCPCSPG